MAQKPLIPGFIPYEEPSTPQIPGFIPYNEPSMELEDKPWYEKANDWWSGLSINQPLLDIAKYTTPMAEAYEKDPANTAISRAAINAVPFLGNFVNAYEGYLKDYKKESFDPNAFVGHVGKKAGEMATGLTSPFNIGLTAATMGAGSLANVGRSALASGAGPAAIRAMAGARTLGRAAKVGSLPIAASGAADIASGANIGEEEPVDWEKVFTGGAKLAGGTAGMMAPLPKYTRADYPRTTVSSETVPPRGGMLGTGADDFRAGFRGDTPPPPTRGPIVDIPEGSILSPDQQVVTVRIPDKATVSYWESRGYVVIPQLRSTDGFMQMVHQDAAPVFRNTDTGVKPAEAQPSARPDIPGPIGEDQIGFGPGQPIRVPREQVDGTYVTNMAKNGYRIADQDATHYTFDQTAEPGGRGSVMGSSAPPPNEPPSGGGFRDVDDLLAKAQALGINPDNYSSLGELAHVVQNAELNKMAGTGEPPDPMQRVPIPADPFAAGTGRGLQPGEVGGRVAPFEQPSRATNLFEVTQELKQNGANESVVKRAEELINGYKTSSQARTDYVEIMALLDNTSNLDEAQNLQYIADLIKEKGNALNSAETQGMGVIRPLEEFRPTGGVRVTNGPASPGAQKYTIGPDGKLVPIPGPRNITKWDRPLETVGQYQPQLPGMMGMIQGNRLKNIGNPDINTDVGMLQEPPVQQNMLDPLVDQEISQFLRGEGRTEPPDIRDIGESGSGSGSISEMARPTREQLQATDEGYAVLPPGYKGDFDDHIVIRVLSDGSRVIDPVRTRSNTSPTATPESTLFPPIPAPPKTPQEMRNELRLERLKRRAQRLGISESTGRDDITKVLMDKIKERENWTPEQKWEDAAKLAADYGIDATQYPDLDALNDAITVAIDEDMERYTDEENVERRKQEEGTREMFRRIFSDLDDDPMFTPQEGDSPEMIALKQKAAEYEHYSRENELTPEQEAEFSEMLNKIESGGTKEGRNFLSEATGIPPEDFIRMEVGERTAILRNMQGSYAEHGARVAGKELLQNAIDETPAGGTIEVTLDHHGTNAKGRSITVKDNGPGIPLEVLKNEYVTLTGSGKRGKTSHTGRKTIGEMGVGKATYLLGTDSFEIRTTVKEADGNVWKYEVDGNPDSMIGEDAQGNPVPPVRIIKTKMFSNTPTGTTVRVYDNEKKNIDAAEGYFKTFADYSDTPVTVVLTGNRYIASPYLNLNKTVTPRAAGSGQHVMSGTAPGGDFHLNVPDTAIWQDNSNSILAILTNRGMFQGVETIYPGGRGRIPDRVIVNIEPNVSAQDAKNYPLTSPTRERMKGPFNVEVTRAIKKHIMEAAEKKREADIQAAFDALTPQPNPLAPGSPGFVSNDRGGRYTPTELDNFNNNPRVQAIAREMGNMLDVLDALFPTEQVARTEKYGFDLADVDKGGINITPPSDDTKSLIMVNLHSALHDAAGDPKLAGEIFAHTVLHEFTHNIAREEGAGFTWAFRSTDSKFGTERRAQVAATISKLLAGPGGGYDPSISQLLQEHTAARGRQDTTVDFIARQAQGRFIESPRQGGVSGSDTGGGKGTTRGKGSVLNMAGGRHRAGPAAAPTKMQKAAKIFKEALAVPTNATTMLDLSGPGRQGLPLALTPQFWGAFVRMFPALNYSTYKYMNDKLMDKPLMRKRINPDGTVRESFGEEVGVKTFSPASEPGPNADATASRWLETGEILGPERIKGVRNPLAATWKHTVGYPIRAFNRGYLTFLNHLNVNRTEYLFKLMQNMSEKGLDTGRAPMKGLLGGIHLPSEVFGRSIGIPPGSNIGFTRKVTPAEAMDLNPYHNIPLAKEIAEFTNAATGHATAKGGLSLENAVSKIGPVLFSPGLLNSRIRMMNVVTYAMASPFVRRQYLKALLSTAAAWFVMTEMIKNALGPEATVNYTDWTSADAGKIRVGDARLDLGGGFLQFAVAYARLWHGGSTSSASGEFHRFGSGYQAQTSEDMMERFFVNKLNPVSKFAWDVASASEYNPMHVGDRSIQLFVNLFSQDLYEISKEDPDLLPVFGTTAFFGGGTQIYSKGESVSKFIDPENDWNVTGGGVRDVMPWNWRNEPGEPSRNFPWSER